MRKHLSVFALVCRQALGGGLLLCALSAAAMIGLFALALARGAGSGLEYLVDSSGIRWVPALSFPLMTWVLCRVNRPGGSRVVYTLARLQVSERAVFFWQALAGVILLLLLWAVQAAAALGLALWVSRDPAPIGGQAVFLAFYRSPTLHTLLPLQDTVVLWRDGLLSLAGGFAAACSSFCRRRGKFSFPVLLVAGVWFGTFPQPLGEFSTAVFLAGPAALIAIGCSLYPVLRKEGREDE